MRILSFFCVLGALTMACGGRSASPSDAKPGSVPAAIPSGKWGGEHAVLEVSRSGATVQFDCAHGSIPGPLALDADGHFSLPGDFVSEHGGPIRVGEVEKHRPARYSGRVHGRKMVLSVGMGTDRDTIGPYTLEHGSDGWIVRCR